MFKLKCLIFYLKIIKWFHVIMKGVKRSLYKSFSKFSSCSLTGPFIGLFINTCGCRKTAIIGGIVNATGWILSAYASNVHYLFITFGVTAGEYYLCLEILLNVLHGFWQFTCRANREAKQIS